MLFGHRCRDALALFDFQRQLSITNLLHKSESLFDTRLLCHHGIDPAVAVLHEFGKQHDCFTAGIYRLEPDQTVA